MDYPDTFYHLLSRGNERKEICRDEKDHLMRKAPLTGRDLPMS
jgi:hypothetical protein